MLKGSQYLLKGPQYMLKARRRTRARRRREEGKKRARRGREEGVLERDVWPHPPSYSPWFVSMCTLTRGARGRDETIARLKEAASPVRLRLLRALASPSAVARPSSLSSPSRYLQVFGLRVSGQGLEFRVQAFAASLAPAGVFRISG